MASAGAWVYDGGLGLCYQLGPEAESILRWAKSSEAESILAFIGLMEGENLVGARSKEWIWEKLGCLVTNHVFYLPIAVSGG